MAKQFTLGKNERLKSRKGIEQLFHEGKSFSVYPFKVFYLLRETNGPPRFGAGVSTKNFRKAVERNRIKRLLREAYRLQKLPLQEKLMSDNQQMDIFFIYTVRELPVFEFVTQKVAVVLKKLLGIINEDNTTNR